MDNLNTTDLKSKSIIILNERQKELLRKEKNREDFDDRFAPLLANSLKKDGLKYGYACNYSQTKDGSIFNYNQIVIFDEKGNYDLF